MAIHDDCDSVLIPVRGLGVEEHEVEGVDDGGMNVLPYLHTCRLSGVKSGLNPITFAGEDDELNSKCSTLKMSKNAMVFDYPGTSGLLQE